MRPIRPYIAILQEDIRQSGKNVDLILSMLYFLDDRHIEVRIWYHDRWPRCLRFSWLSNLRYLGKLLCLPPSVLLVPFELMSGLGLALHVLRHWKRHQVIVVLDQPVKRKNSWWQRWFEDGLIRRGLAQVQHILTAEPVVAAAFPPGGGWQEKVSRLKVKDRTRPHLAPIDTTLDQPIVPGWPRRQPVHILLEAGRVGTHPLPSQ